ncbi:hypothetical protein J6590_023515 [Homalodisca vitripennis]|nr:hypothetical protein J6590_023515 [Homalodisca vitripennis]
MCLITSKCQDGTSRAARMFTKAVLPYHERSVSGRYLKGSQDVHQGRPSLITRGGE